MEKKINGKKKPTKRTTPLQESSELNVSLSYLEKQQSLVQQSEFAFDVYDNN